jgi:hypothetical protein
VRGRLSAYAKALESIAELQENVAKSSQLDWITTFATAEATSRGTWPRRTPPRPASWSGNCADGATLVRPG